MEENMVVVKEKNSKVLVALVIILILIVLVLSGYLVYDKFISKAPEQEMSDKVDNNNSNKENTKKVLLKYENKDVVYNYTGDDIYSGHKVPYININSETADKFNQSILAFYDEFKNEKGMPQPYTSYKFNYQYYVDNEFVSVIVSHSQESGGINPTKVYNINRYTGKEVTKEDILKYLNITDSEYTNKIVDAYNSAGPLPGSSDLLSRTNETEKEENRKFIEKTNSSNIEKLTKNDIIGIYTNNEQLYVVFVMDTLVGAGRSEAILDVNNKRINYIY